MIKKAVDLRPNDGYIVDSLGWAYHRLGRDEEAVKALEAAALLKPEDSTINDHLGDALLEGRAEARGDVPVDRTPAISAPRRKTCRRFWRSSLDGLDAASAATGSSAVAVAEGESLADDRQRVYGDATPFESQGQPRPISDPTRPAGHDSRTCRRAQQTASDRERQRQARTGASSDHEERAGQDQSRPPRYRPTCRRLSYDRDARGLRRIAATRSRSRPERGSRCAADLTGLRGRPISTRRRRTIW